MVQSGASLADASKATAVCVVAGPASRGASRVVGGEIDADARPITTTDPTVGGRSGGHGCRRVTPGADHGSGGVRTAPVTIVRHARVPLQTAISGLAPELPDPQSAVHAGSVRPGSTTAPPERRQRGPRSRALRHAHTPRAGGAPADAKLGDVGTLVAGVVGRRRPGKQRVHRDGRQRRGALAREPRQGGDEQQEDADCATAFDTRDRWPTPWTPRTKRRSASQCRRYSPRRREGGLSSYTPRRCRRRRSGRSDPGRWQRSRRHPWRPR